MKPSTSVRLAAGKLFLAVALCATAHATDIVNVTTALTTADPTQLGRLSRNGVPQDWSGSEPFSGVINPTTAYHYRTFIVDAATVSLGQFIQITIDDRGPVSSQANLFASAYFTSYAPNSAGAPNLGFDTHWLGDAGSSGNFFGGTDPAFFQVTVPLGSSLVVVVSNSGGANLGVGEPFNLLVESFSSTAFDPAITAPVSPPLLTPVPEPSTYGVAGAAILAGLILRRRRQNPRAA